MIGIWLGLAFAGASAFDPRIQPLGTPGWWHPTDDYSTLFQDRAGTTPVTGVGQSVGLWLDKWKYLATGANLISPTAWAMSSAGGTSTAVNSPSGTLTLTGDGTNQARADVQMTTVAGTWYRVQMGGLTAAVSAQVGTTQGATDLQAAVTLPTGTPQVWFLATGTTSWLRLSRSTSGAAVATAITCTSVAGAHARAVSDAARGVTTIRPKSGLRNLLGNSAMTTHSVTVLARQYTLSFKGTGTVTLTGAATGSLVGTGATNRVSLSFTPTAGTLTLTVSGSVTEAQLETGAAATAFQVVNTPYHCTEVPYAECRGIWVDGVDDAYQTPAIDLTSTDKIAVFAGVYKRTDAARAVVMETGSNASVNGVNIEAPNTAGATQYLARSAGTIGASAATNAFAAPDSAVISAVASISGDSLSLRRNSAVVASSSADQGTGNYGNLVLNISSRTGASLFFAGELYGQLGIGRSLSAAEISACERFMSINMPGVTL